MNEITIDADIKNLNEITSFLNNIIDNYDCSMEVKFQLELAIEEIYVNIAYYAYPNAIGSTTIRYDIVNEDDKPPLLVLDILDQGEEYNPLEEKNPDISLDAMAREIGGLGIFIVKESMDFVDYHYENGNNIFTIKKYLK